MSMNDISKKINKNIKRKAGKNKAVQTVTGEVVKPNINPAREKKLLEEQRKAEIDKNARLAEFDKLVDYSKTVEVKKEEKQAEDERELIDNRVNHKRVIVADAAAEMQYQYDLATDDSKGVLDDLGQGHVIDQIEAEAHNLGSTAETIKQQFKPKIDSIKKTTEIETKKQDMAMQDTLEKIAEPIAEPEPEPEGEDEDDMSPLSHKRRYM